MSVRQWACVFVGLAVGMMSASSAWAWGPLGGGMRGGGARPGGGAAVRPGGGAAPGGGIGGAGGGAIPPAGDRRSPAGAGATGDDLRGFLNLPQRSPGAEPGPAVLPPKPPVPAPPHPVPPVPDNHYPPLNPARADQIRDTLNGRWDHIDTHPFTPAWYAEHPNVWHYPPPPPHPGPHPHADAWAVATWGAMTTWLAITSPPVVYSTGGTTTYVDQSVTVVQASPTEAATLAQTGAPTPAESVEWMPLGVFALTMEGQPHANQMVQLAVSHEGVLRGNYCDLVTGVALDVEGAVDRQTQRVAWSSGSAQGVVWETTLNTLTQDQGPVTLHLPGGMTQNWTLVRLKNPAETTPVPSASPAAPASPVPQAPAVN